MDVERSKKDTILIVDDTPMNLELLVNELTDAGFEVSVAMSGQIALRQLKYDHPDIILLDVLMPGMDGFETCRRLKASRKTKDIPVIFMTALADTADKVKGFNVGAVDYVTKPLQYEEVKARVKTHLMIQRLQKHLEEKNAHLQQEIIERKRVEEALQEANDKLEQRVAGRTADLKKANIELQAALFEVERLKNRLQVENVYLQEEIKLQHNFEEIISQSDAFKKVLHLVEQGASTDATILILGETGTGKELIARAVHSISSRSNRPLVKVSCAALPASLIDSELFGHEKGAFTGAFSRKPGRFELADKGTIFLDEIGDLPLALQAKLLRVLQEGEFERLGGLDTIRVDVRVIAATNRDLEGAVNAGEFREDLYYRLNVFPIFIPPLRERKEDIPLLGTHFVKKYSTKLGKKIDSIPQEVMGALQGYPWPGNIRELENIIERATILASSSTIQPDEILEMLRNVGLRETHSDILEDVERNHVRRVLEETDGVIEGVQGAAKRLGLHPNTLRYRIKKLGIERP